jgi:adenylate kinase
MLIKNKNIIKSNPKKTIMKIAISGTPCTGKTEVSEVLSKKLNYKLISINDFAEELDAFVGYDKKRESRILDMDRLEKEIKKLEEDIILEGHTSHLFPADIVIVLRCNPEVLKKRLDKRYPKNPLKVRENLEVEILGVITSEALTKNKKVYEIDTSENSVKKNVDDILKILNGNAEEFKVGKIDWLEKYFDWIELG